MDLMCTFNLERSIVVKRLCTNDYKNRLSFLVLLSVFLFCLSCSKGNSGSSVAGPPGGNIISSVTRSYYELQTGPYPSNMISKNGYLFWSEASQTPINKIIISGGETIPLANSMSFVSDYIVTAQYIYWIDVPNLAGVVGTPYSNACLKKTSLDGTSTIVLVCGAESLYVDDTNVFWMVPIPDPTGLTSSTIQNINKMQLDGSGIVTLASTTNSVRFLTGDTNNIYWTEGTQLHRMAKDGSGNQVILDGIGDQTTKPVFAPEGIYLAYDIGIVDTTMEDEGYELGLLPSTGGAFQILLTYKDYWENGNRIGGLAADDTNIYWINKQTVNSVLKSGGTSTTLAAEAQSPNGPNVQFTGIVLNGDTIYWSGTLGNRGNIKSISKYGGPVVTWEDNTFLTSNLSLAAGAIYWLETAPGYSPTRRIAKLNTTDGTISTLLTGIEGGPMHQFSVDDQFVFIADQEMVKRVPVSGGKLDFVASEDPGVMVDSAYTDGTNVYWTALSSSQHLMRVPVGGGLPVLVADNLPCNIDSGGFIFHDRNLYCFSTIPGPGSINYLSFYMISIDTGAVSQITANINGYLSTWTTDGMNIYYSNQDLGTVYKISVSNGDMTQMFTTNLADITQLASDGEYLYWINQSTLAKTSISDGKTEYILNQLLNEGLGIAVDDNNIFWSYYDGLSNAAIYMATPK